MEIRQLKIFSTVAQANSFTRAAELMGYAQSNVTAQIRALEDELGIRLFERLSKRIALTPEGEKLLVYAEQIIKLSGEALETISTPEPRGTINIGVPESLCVFRLPGLFKAYRKRYPQVKLVLKLGTPQDFRHWLKDNTVDLAFFLDQPVDDADLIAATLQQEPMVVIGEPEHVLLPKGCLEARDMEQECLILTEQGCSYRAQIEKHLSEAGVSPASTLEFESVEAIKQFVMSGLGIALLPRAAVESELKQSRLADLNWSGPEFVMYTQVVYHRDKWISATLQSLLNLVEEYFGDHMPTARKREAI